MNPIFQAAAERAAKRKYPASPAHRGAYTAGFTEWAERYGQWVRVEEQVLTMQARHGTASRQYAEARSEADRLLAWAAGQ